MTEMATSRNEVDLQLAVRSGGGISARLTVAIGGNVAKCFLRKENENEA